MKYIISILLIAVLASCKTGKNAIDQTAQNLAKKWELTSLDGKAVSEARPIILNFNADQTVNGYIGCNSANGTYEITDNTIQFSKLAVTRKACKEMDMEQSVLNVLNSANRFKLEKGKMTLFTDSKEIATFTELIEGEITNKYWKLMELSGNSVEMVGNQEREQFAMFTNEGTVSGFSGCNHFNGFYELSEGNQISIDEKISSTLKSCPDVDLDETEYLRALVAGSRFQVDGERMILIGRDGKKVAVFEVVYF